MKTTASPTTDQSQRPHIALTRARLSRYIDRCVDGLAPQEMTLRLSMYTVNFRNLRWLIRECADRQRLPPEWLELVDETMELLEREALAGDDTLPDNPFSWYYATDDDDSSPDPQRGTDQ